MLCCPDVGGTAGVLVIPVACGLVCTQELFGKMYGKALSLHKYSCCCNSRGQKCLCFPLSILGGSAWSDP